LKRDIASETDLYPILIKAKPFNNLHKILIKTLYKFSENKKNLSLLVLGLSPTFSPYDNHFELVKSFANKDGRIVGIDYNLNVIEECFIHLHKNNIFEFFKPKLIVKGKLNDRFLNYLKENKISLNSIIEKDFRDIYRLKEKTFLFMEHDLKDGLNFPPNSFSFIDATLTLHHITAYKKKYFDFLKQAYSILERNGIFHIGEGFVDMGGSERKIDDIVSKLNKKVIFVKDCRDQTHPVFLEYFDNKKLFLKKEPQDVDIEIDERGIVKIKNNEFPLMSKKDVEHFENINKFYDFSINEIKKIKHPAIEKVIKRAEEERRYALKGLVEYYLPLEVHKRMLEEVGFKVKVKRPNIYLKNRAEFGNLICTKY